MATTDDELIFSGEFLHALDEKNRVTIPSDWRSETGPTEFFVVPDQRGEFLMVMPAREFRRVNDVVSANPAISPQEKRSFVRQFYSRSRKCNMDRQGRMLIPEEHRKQVGLKGEVMMVGTQARFEVWDPARWTRVCDVESGTYQRVSDLVGL